MSNRHLIVTMALVTAGGACLGCQHEQPTWTPAAQFASDAISIQGADIGMSDDGSAIAVWGSRVAVEIEARSYVVWAARFTPQSGWEDPTRLSAQGTGRGAGFPTVAVSDDGYAVAAWAEWGSDDPNGDGVWIARFDPDAGWSEPVHLAGDEYSATVAAANGGRAVVAWTRDFDSVWASSFESESQWSAPVRVDRACVPFERPDEPPLFLDGADNWPDNRTVLSSSKNPKVAINDNGHAALIWDDNEGETNPLESCNEQMNVRASRFVPGQGWSAPASFATPSTLYGTLHAAVGVDAAGNVLAGSLEGQIHRYTEASGWTVEAPVNLDLVANASGETIINRKASVAIASSGQAVAVWETFSQRGLHAIRVLRFSPERGWSELATFPATTESAPTTNRTTKSPTILDSASADLAVNDVGDAFVVWHEHARDGSFNVWVNQYRTGGDWSQPTALSLDESFNAVGPDVVIDAQGRGIAIWIETEYARDSTRMSRLMWSRFE